MASECTCVTILAACAAEFLAQTHAADGMEQLVDVVTQAARDWRMRANRAESSAAASRPTKSKKSNSAGEVRSCSGGALMDETVAAAKLQLERMQEAWPGSVFVGMNLAKCVVEMSFDSQFSGSVAVVTPFVPIATYLVCRHENTPPRVRERVQVLDMVRGGAACCPSRQLALPRRPRARVWHPTMQSVGGISGM